MRRAAAEGRGTPAMSIPRRGGRQSSLESGLPDPCPPCLPDPLPRVPRPVALAGSAHHLEEQLRPRLGERDARSENLLILRIDETELPGVPRSVCYVAYEDPEKTVNLCVLKIDADPVSGRRAQSRLKLNRLARDLLRLEDFVPRRDRGSHHEDIRDERDRYAELQRAYHEGVAAHGAEFCEYDSPLDILNGVDPITDLGHGLPTGSPAGS
jgi:hypothetical protein